MSGKGSRQRPCSVDRKTFEDNWDKIFNKSKVEKELKELKELSRWNHMALAERQEKAWMKNEFYDVWDEK